MAVSLWLNAGVSPAQVAEWADRSTDVLLRVYAKCIAEKQDEAKRRILEATETSNTGTPDHNPGPRTSTTEAPETHSET